MKYLDIRNGIKTLGLVCVLTLGTTVADAGYKAGYYNSLNGKCGAELMKAIQKLSAGHKEISYGDATWSAFRSTDVKTVGGVDYWWDMYSSNLVEISGHGGMNIEHSVANSWWEGVKNAAYKDIVHLNPSDATANNRKGNYPLGEVATATWENGVTFVGTPKAGTGGGSKYVYEPCDEYKGDFARVFMYMFCAYRDMEWGTRFTWMYDTSDPLMFRPWAQELVLRWSASDAVSEKERKRNDGIEKEQGNRNPFIDLPDLADHIWGSKKNEPYKVEGAGEDPEPDPEPDNQVIYNWLGGSDPNGADDWTLDTAMAGKYPVMSWKEYNKKYYLNASGYENGNIHAVEAYALSPEVDMTGVKSAKFSFSHAAKFQTTLRDLCKVVVVNHDINSNADGYMKVYEVPSWPVADAWKFSDSGEIDITEYAAGNKHISVGFLYKSSEAGADTWEINNAKLVLEKESTGVTDIAQEYDNQDDSCLVEVWGRNILAPEGAVIYDLNGRRVSGENVAPGIYIVAKPTFSKSVKVMVR